MNEYVEMLILIVSEMKLLHYLLLAVGILMFMSDGAVHIALLFRLPGFIVSLLARLTMPFGVNRSLFGYPTLVHASLQGYAGVCAVLLRRGASIRLSTVRGNVNAMDVSSDKCFGYADVQKVLAPYVKEMKREDDEKEKLRKAALAEKRAKDEEKRKEIAPAGIPGVSLDSAILPVD